MCERKKKKKERELQNGFEEKKKIPSESWLRLRFLPSSLNRIHKQCVAYVLSFVENKLLTN